MKRLSFIATIIMVVAFSTSCEKEENGVIDEKEIVGTWTIVHEYGVEIDEDGNKETWDYIVPEEEREDSEHWMVFNFDNTGSIGGTYGDEFTYSIIGGTKLALKFDDSSNSTWTILTLTAHELVLEQDVKTSTYQCNVKRTLEKLY